MSELSQALAIGAALPKLHAEAVEKVTPLLGVLTISELTQLTEALELRKSQGIIAGNLRELLMEVRNESIRVAEWHMVPDPENHNETCEHKRYKVGKNGGRGTTRHGEIGDPTWLEAWIA
jgi:hypothetical protein